MVGLVSMRPEEPIPLAFNDPPAPRKRPVVEMVKASKTWRGIYQADYNCPKCRSPLVSKDDAILEADTCPNCNTVFVFGPGVQAAYRKHKAAIEQKKEEQRLDRARTEGGVPGHGHEPSTNPDEVGIDASGSSTPTDAIADPQNVSAWIIVPIVVGAAAFLWYQANFGRLPPSPDPYANKASTRYTVLQDKIVNGGRLRDVFVRIDRAVPEEEVRRIANEIRSRGGNPGALSIGFLLPAMEIGKGGWARAVFKPDLRIDIFGVTPTEEAGLRKPVNARGRILGTWLWVLPSSSRTRTISEENGEFYLTQRFANGEQGEERLVEMVPGRKYARASDSHGDYMLINSQGQLELWDPDGRIETLQRVDGR